MGDSLALAQAAMKSTAKTIVFCGVHFMAETAKILNPEKLVLVPDMNAGCSLADSAPKDEFEAWIKENPGHTVISYINCSAEVKALSDIIVTSSSAEKILNALPKDEKILFGPDKYLGAYLNRKTGRDMKLWRGSCQVHETFSENALEEMMELHPNAQLLAHPECPDNILTLANYIGSTTGIIDYAVKSDCNEFIIATEPGVIHQMELKAPNKKYYPLANLDKCPCNVCPHMRLNTLEKIANCLEYGEPQIIMEESLRERAKKPLLKMLELS